MATHLNSITLKKIARSSWFETGLALAIFAALTVALTWPTIRDFSTKIVSDGNDARHNIWILWNVQQALMGRQPLFDAPLLYYPAGISLLTHGVGPLEGIFALPFWFAGPSAAYNAAILIGFGLTGFSMYLLGRNLRFNFSVSILAGTMLMVAQMHLAGLLGHIEKTYIGLLPLVLLSANNMLNLQRRRRWAVITAVCLLLTILHSGWQFILAALGIGLFALVTFIFAARGQRRVLLGRLGLFIGASLILVGPLLFATLQAASNPALRVNVSSESAKFQPDLIEFFAPSQYSQWLGVASGNFLATRGIEGSIETTVALPYIGLLLVLLAVISSQRAMWRWLFLLLICMVFALGPTLKILGRTEFTAYQLPVILPYAWLTSLPGLGFIRTPGQFMLLGDVAFAVVASYGVMWLWRRWRRTSIVMTWLALGLLLVETWPQPWPQETLRPVPPFYQQLASDPAEYGVFDLPLKPVYDTSYVSYSSNYELYQITHHKGIAAGYLSRTYQQHPLFACMFANKPLFNDVRVNGRASDCYGNGQFELARQNYRYVVLHKPQPEYSDYQPGAWGETQAQTFIERVFPGASPIFEDDLTRVYAVSLQPITTTLRLGQNWGDREDDWRWAKSPATLEIISPRTQTATLEIPVKLLFDPSSPDPVDVSAARNQGVLNIEADHQSPRRVSVTAGQSAVVPLELSPGLTTITLTLQAGNFRLSDYGGDDDRLLSFAPQSMNLRTLP